MPQEFSYLTPDQLKELRDKKVKELQSMKGWSIIIRLLDDIQQIERQLEEQPCLPKP